MGKSAFRAIRGEDALFEYQSGTSYQATKYVERNLQIFKSKIQTATSFVPSEWEPVAVPNITGFSGVTASTITTTGHSIQIGLTPSGVVAGTYQAATITVDEAGRISFASGNTTAAGGIPSPPDSSIQFNDNNSLSGLSTFLFNKASQGLEQGTGTTASGLYSHSQGFFNIASGFSSHAEGGLTVNSGDSANFNTCFTGDQFNIAYGDASHAEGGGTRACGDTSHSEGLATIASGPISHTHGIATSATSIASFAGGYASIASADFTIAHGYATSAVTENAIAFGYCTLASGDSSMAFGFCNKTLNNFSLSFGENTCSIGVSSLSFGQNTISCGIGSLSFGENTISCGIGSLSFGENTCSIGDYSLLFGQNTISCGNNSMASGFYSIACGNRSLANGFYTIAKGDNSVANGFCTIACASNSHAEGVYTISSGVGSHVSGVAISGIELRASGCSAFNHSANDISQTNGYGANADYSAILGGISHNIESGNTHAAIIGGYSINLTGTTYSCYTAVSNLAIWEIPQTSSCEDVLVWDNNDKKIKRKTVVGNPSAGSNGDIQLNDGGGGFTTMTNFKTEIPEIGLTFGTRTGTTIGSYSFSIGLNNCIAGFRSVAFGEYNVVTFSDSFAVGYGNNVSAENVIVGGCNNEVSGDNSFTNGSLNIITGNDSTSFGKSNCVGGSGSVALGLCNKALANYSLSIGKCTTSCGFYSFAGGVSDFSGATITACGRPSFNFSRITDTGFTNGYGANAPSSAILGGVNHNIDSQAFNAVIIGGNNINLSGNTYSGYTAVGNLVIWDQPVTSSCANALVWDDNDKKIKINSTLSGTTSPSGIDGSIQYNNNGSFSGDSLFLFDGVNNALTLGTRSGTVGVRSVVIGNADIASGQYSVTFGKSNTSTGDYSHAQGYNTCALGFGSHSEGLSSCATGGQSHAEGYKGYSIGDNSHAEGACTWACGDASHSEGFCTIASATTSHAEGYLTCATGGQSHAEGYNTHAAADNSHAEGGRTASCGVYSHAGGFGDLNAFVIASGFASFNHSHNDSGQTNGYGANADYSAILGGINHNIESGNTHAIIIGGTEINLTGTSYSGYTAVGNLAVWDQPLSGASGDEVLVWDNIDKKVKVRSQADVAGASDMDLKQNISISKNSLSNINQIAGYEFEWNENYPDYSKIGMKDYGLLAQELESIYPEMVSCDFRGNDGKTYKAIKYNRIIPILINAVNELTDRVKHLENKLKIKNK